MSRRRMTITRKLIYWLLVPVFKGWLKLTWYSCRISIIGEEHITDILRERKPMIPCYWHQMDLLCSYYMITLQKKGLKPGFLISPSLDGEVPANAVASMGAHVIRGSSSRTGAQAIRDLYQVISKEGVSPVNTPDGPRGPIYKMKPGVLMLSQMTGAPIIPIAYAAKKAWIVTSSWDHFMIPRPFTKIVLIIGEAVTIDKKIKFEALQGMQDDLEIRLNNLSESARKLLVNTDPPMRIK